MRIEEVKKIPAVIIGLLSISFLALTYFSKYFIIPCFILTIIDLVLIRNIINRSVSKQDRQTLEKNEKKCVLILVAILVLICGWMFAVYHVIDDFVIKLTLSAVIAVLMIIGVFVTYTITAIQMQIIENIK